MTKLAIFGGNSIQPIDVPFEQAWPETLPQDMEAVNRVFDSGKFVGLHNDEVDAFEKEYAEYVGCQYALALGTGTASLHACVAAAGCQPGDEVIVPALTFLASASAVLHNVSIPVFADIDPVTYNIDPESVETKITNRTRAIMAVDLHGLPADYPALMKIAQKHNLVIIDDGSHAAGAEQFGKKVGSLADISGVSIMPVKQLPTCGEGGFFSTDKEEFYNRASMVRMFGEVIRKGQDRAYNAYTLGWNYRLNPVQAAYGRSQLKRLDQNSQLFRDNGTYLSRQLQRLPGIIPPFVPQGSTHAYHMFRIRFDPAAAGLDLHPGRFTKAVELAMAAEGLPLRFYQSAPVPSQMLFKLKEGFGNGIPWTLPGANPIDYDIEDFPNTLDVLETTRCIGRGGSSGPNYFRSCKIMDLYVEGFQKVWENLPEIAAHAQKMDYQVPWSNTALSTRGTWVTYTHKSSEGNN